jgi:hypothetical protein
MIRLPDIMSSLYWRWRDRYRGTLYRSTLAIGGQKRHFRGHPRCPSIPLIPDFEIRIENPEGRITKPALDRIAE